MKKVLLSLAAVAMTLSASAEVYELNAADATDIVGTFVEEKLPEGNSNGVAAHYQPLESLKLGDFSFTFSKATGTTEPAYYDVLSTSTSASAVKTIRPYKNNTMTISAPAGKEFTQIEFTMSAGAFSAASAGTVSNKTWTSETPVSEVTLTIGTNARISALSINTGAPVVVEKKKVANIAAFLEAADTENEVEITSPVTAVYQNGRYLYIKDATAATLVYGDLTTTYNNGDVIPAGITGIFTNYSNGNLQMSNPVATSFQAGTAGTAVEAEEIPVEEISADIVNTYVVFKNVTVAAGTDAKSFTLTDETGTITLYNQFTGSYYNPSIQVKTGSDLTVYGFVAIHSGALQILPVSFEGEGGEVPPVIPPVTGEGDGVFDFTDPSSLNPAQATPAASTGVEVPGVTFYSGAYTVKGEGGSTTVRLWPCGSPDHKIEYRVYNGGTITIEGSESFEMVEFTGALLNTISTETGLIECNDDNTAVTWTKGDAAVEITKVVFNVATVGSNKRADINTIKVYKHAAGIETVAADNNAAVEVYNLQGVRVNPENVPAGLYIRRQGNSVQKIVIR